MKIKVVFSFMMLSFCIVNAQISPMDIVISTPAMPLNINDFKVQDDFQKKVSVLKDSLANEISRRKEEAKEAGKDMENKMGKQMMQQTGANISAADMQKMKSGKMSKAEKEAMANRMMQQMANMSLDEAKDINKLSPEGKKAYSEGLSTEMMAAAQADPNKNLAQQKRNMNRAELAEEQSAITNRIQAKQSKFEDKLAQYRKNKEIWSIPYNVCLESTHKYIDSHSNVSLGSDINEGVELQKCFTAFYNNAAPYYKGMLDERLVDIQALTADYNRLEAIQNMMEYSITGVKKPENKVALMHLEALQEYLSYLRDLPMPTVTYVHIYKFKNEGKVKAKDKEKVVE